MTPNAKRATLLFTFFVHYLNDFLPDQIEPNLYFLLKVSLNPISHLADDVFVEHKKPCHFNLTGK